MNYQLSAQEKIVDIQKIQTNFVDLLKQAKAKGIYYKIVDNGKSLGYLLPNDFWDDILEDYEMFSSPNFLKSLEEA